jgi:conjugative relaxase-like TrwC/TraI family protein
VLSIGKLVLGQQRYYERQVAHGEDDYYAGRGEAPGQWVGSGAGELELSGRVSSAQFSRLLSGSDPREPGARLRSQVGEPSVAALDLTFSAPKSVSVLAAIAPEGVAHELVASHELALRGALEYLEQEALFVRRGHGGARFERAGGLVAAAYRHRMSRALDPQLHTHVVAANLARSADGRWTALHHPSLYRAAKTAGYLYQAQLRAEVSERLGLRWGPVRMGAAELADVPEAVLSEFSKRRREMQRAAENGGIGLDTKASAESAALATRERKEYGLDTHTWREEVTARAGELGLGEREVRVLVSEGRERSTESRGHDESVEERVFGDELVSSRGLTERANSFDGREVLQEFASAATDGASVQEIRAKAARFAERWDVIHLDDGTMTTAELLETEWRLIDAALARGGEGTGAIDPELDHALARVDRPLSSDRAAAVRVTVSSGDGVSVIQALAGTGKTYTAGVLRELYETAGYQVLGVAPTARAARELAEQAGIPARTPDRLLLDSERHGDGLPARCVLVFDEAGMAPTRASARLLEAAKDAGAKVVAIGDPGQLTSVQAGGWLRTVGERLGAVSLTEVMRQRDPAERRALGALHELKPQPYIKWARSQRRIETFADRGQALRSAIEVWATASASLPSGQAVMIARDNRARQELNDAARELWRALGLLGEEHSYGPVSLAVGDRVICRRNDRHHDVDNGMRGTVRHLDPQRVVIDTDGGLVRELPAGYVEEHLEHAYALTGHGMQGATVEAAIVVASPHELSAGWSYTALSRARRETRLLIYEQQETRERSELAPRDPAQDRSDLLARAEARMAERDSEDLAIERLPEAGRADDQALKVAHAVQGEEPQERGALRAEPPLSDPASTARLRELGELIERAEAQLQALPRGVLREIDELEAHATTLAEQRETLKERLAALPAPRRRFGRIRDEHPLERAHYGTTINAIERQYERLLTERDRLASELGDPQELRAERDGIESELRALEREQTELRDRLTEREIQQPSGWVREAFGERPKGPASRWVWERGVREAARYRVEYELDDPSDTLGPQPEQREQKRDWERARQAIERSQRQLGREVTVERDSGWDLGR